MFQRGFDRGRSSVAKVKLLRHKGRSGARGIDGDDENQLKLLRHSSGVLLEGDSLTV